MAAKIIPDYIRDVLNYDPETGDLTWKVTGIKKKAGDVAGSLNSVGYRTVVIDQSRYLSHRLAWFLTHNEQPNVIDHINRDRADNRLANLRNVTQSQNLLNKARAGVVWNNCRGLKYARAYYKDKFLYFGPNIMTAHYRRIMAERADHPIGLPAPDAVG
jgi:hypothetical protein